MRACVYFCVHRGKWCWNLWLCCVLSGSAWCSLEALSCPCCGNRGLKRRHTSLYRIHKHGRGTGDQTVCRGRRPADPLESTQWKSVAKVSLHVFLKICVYMCVCSFCYLLRTFCTYEHLRNVSCAPRRSSTLHSIFFFLHFFFSFSFLEWGTGQLSPSQDSWSHETREVGQEEFTHDRVMWHSVVYPYGYFSVLPGQKKGWSGSMTLLLHHVVIESKS